MTPRRILLPALAALAAAWLAACGNAPPTPDWQMNAHGSLERATRAYLAGDDRVAELEWERARAEVARTGQPELAARLALARCAAEAASLAFSGCPDFAALRGDASAADAAYADYLAGRLEPARAALLPEAQRAPARDVGAIAAVADPLSRLVAAAAALQAGRATPETLVAAVDAASSQGWRRPLLAWLLARQQHAHATGDTALAQGLQRRIELVQSSTPQR
ncbi:hypothetical protein [Comamonas flocculans]|uniref:Uncharacterized protein n=1 Tax=Comamonas flocculans TaxID=2597701 RepID=A0A5B8RT72_9BURK|nr:hypothetical protein [Comamonas flocculans]QEA11912.1 hypothetical protein FOZ74_02035 [Comamonas flocculans]